MSGPQRIIPRTVLGALTVIGVGLSAGVLGGSAAAADPDADDYRAQYHFTVPDHWKNDPQRPVYVDGKFHYYYLYNSDYDADPSANFGTAWRLATTYDGVVFADQGVAAPKKTNANYDLWSGSAVVDHDDTAGFGAGAVVMLVTQMDHPTPQQQATASGPQAQFLWYSTDGGRNFRPVRRPAGDRERGAQGLPRPEGGVGCRARAVGGADRRARPRELLHLARPEGLDADVGVRQRRHRHDRVPRPVPDPRRRRHAEVGVRRERERLRHERAGDVRVLDGIVRRHVLRVRRDRPAVARPRVRLVRRGDVGRPGRAAGPSLRRRLDEQLGLRPLDPDVDLRRVQRHRLDHARDPAEALRRRRSRSSRSRSPRCRTSPRRAPSSAT